MVLWLVLLLFGFLSPIYGAVPSPAPLIQPCQTTILSRTFFNNYKGERILNHLVDSLGIFFKTKTNPKPYYTYDSEIDDWIAHDSPIARSTSPRITWIGHSTFLIQIAGLNILTDPIFYSLSFLYPRNAPPGILPENLPPIDVVIISHMHRDHFDWKSLSFLQKKHNPHMLVPMGAKALCQKLGFNKITEMTWWEEEKISGLTFTFLPAIHWSNRGPFDLNQYLWGSWMIEAEDSHTIYFAGDSAYGKHFKQIAQVFPSIGIALMPIGPNEPHTFTQSSHMNGEEAVQAFVDLNALCFIPMHWGTFRLGTDSFGDPIIRLLNAWGTYDQNSGKTLLLPQFGQAINLI